MRLSQDGVSLWYGTSDAPAPSGSVAAGADTSINIGLQPPDPGATVSVLYRINHGGPQTVAARTTHSGSGAQFYQVHLAGLKAGDFVEYVALYHSGGRQVPSNQDAENHVVSFTLGAQSEAHHGSDHDGAAHPHPAVNDLKEALRAVLRASGIPGAHALEDVFINLYFSHDGHAESFWAEVSRHPELKPHVPRLQFVLQLDTLTSGHTPLVAGLLKHPGVNSMRDVASLDDTALHAIFEKAGAPSHLPGMTAAVHKQTYFASILSTLHAAFPTLAVLRITLGAPHIDPLAAKFLANSPDFHIGTTRVDVYADEHVAHAFQGIPDIKRAGALKEVKRLQRLFAVSNSAATYRGLLTTGLGSAHAIALIPRATFVSHYGHALGGAAAATQVHERAQFINARNLHLRTSIHDALRTPPTRGLGHHDHAVMLRTYASHTGAGGPVGHGGRGGQGHAPPHLNLKAGSLHEDLVKRFPNSTELFGSLALCRCEECESAIGPAAYLVDVLDFLGSSKPNSHGATPLDVLIGNPDKRIAGRRPDLAFMNLTCANTNTAMPYIDIVNEILESYVALGLKLDGSTARDSANSTSAELDANPQFIDQRAYKMLDEAVYPFTLPFNRPLLVARSYLKQLGSSRYELLKTFHKDQTSPAYQRLLAAETLGLSAEEFAILSGQNIEPTAKTHTRHVSEYYGFHGAAAERHGSWVHDLSNVATFLQRTGICFADLRALVATRFISPIQPVGAAWDLLHRIPVSYSALSTLLMSHLAHPAEAMVEIEAAGITAHDLEVLGGEHFEPIRKMVVIDDSGASCDPSSMRLMHFDGAALDDRALDRMHRFIRLYRKSGWKMPDLDRATHALGATDITPELLVHLAHIRQLQADFRIPNVQMLLALWAPIEFRGPDSLYRSLFLNKATHRQGADPAFDQDMPYADVLTYQHEPLPPHLPKLQSALRVSAVDLDLIVADCGLNPDTAELSLNTVSAIYRRAALAHLLKLKVRDFLVLRTLTGVDPFLSPENTIRFATLVTTLSRSGLTAPALDYLVRHVTGASVTIEPHEATILGLARSLRDGLTSIVRDNRVVPDPTGAVTAQKLAMLYDSSVVDELVGIVNGSVSYKAPLITLPAGLTFPTPLAKKVVFDPNAQLLFCKSPLTYADRASLWVLSDDPAYHAAVGSVYQQPLDLIKTALGDFLDADEAQKRLVTDQSSVDQNLNPILLDSQGQVTTDPAQAQATASAVKFSALLTALIPKLIVKLSASLLKTTVADSLKISGAMAQVLLENLVHASADSSKMAIHDLHSLQQTGLTAAFHTTADLTGTYTSEIAHTVSYDGSKVTLPAGCASASWTGMIAPPSAGDFVFTIRTNGTPALWVDNNSVSTSLTHVADTGDWIAAKITLKPGHLYTLRLEVTQLPPQNPAVTLLWQSLAVHRTGLPEACLYPSSILQAFRETYIRLHKASLIVNTLKLTEDEIAYLVKGDGGLPRLDPDALPASRDASTAAVIDRQAPDRISELLRAARLAALHRDLPTTDVKLTKLFETPTWNDGVITFGLVTGWDRTVVDALIGPSGFNLTVTDLRDVLWPIRLMECVRLIDRLGVSPSSLFRWSAMSSDFDIQETIGQEVKKCVHAQYDPETWLTLAKPLNDTLRDAQRNALVTYLLPRMGLQDLNRLYEYFLIDPEMGVCTETSRISLAHSSVQLFVQRCLMNLEDTGELTGVSPDQIDSDQWEKWRKHYRYWQANAEVLLFPENWMEQGLRDDKTPFFTALEGDITQQEVNADNVETAYMNYLEKLAQVARLEIVGTFWQDRDPDTGEHVNTLHVFGRTFHSPHTYFYRTFVNFTTWTPWEEMQVTIEGDHVLPLIWNRRLYVFWPTFARKAVPPHNPGPIKQSSTVPMDSPQPYWQVSLAWTELRHNKWTAKQVSKNAFDMDTGYFVEDDPARYAKFAYSFKTAVTSDPDGTPGSLVIRCLFHGPTITLVPFGWFPIPVVTDTTEVVGAFQVGGCTGESVEPIFGTQPWPNAITPPGTDVEALTFVQGRHKHGLALMQGRNLRASPFLQDSPTQYRLLAPHQFADYLLQAPLFYQDKHRTFFVTPVEEHGPIRQMASAGHAAFNRTGAARAARGKAAAAHHSPAQHGDGHHSAAGNPKQHGAAAGHPPLHVAPNEVSDILIAMEKMLHDIGGSYSRNASGQSSAWGSHAAGHNTHQSGATDVRFETFYHPFVCDFMKLVSRLGVAGLLTEAAQQPNVKHHDYFQHQYHPTQNVAHPLPTETVDFENGPYAIYNQELFFHIPDLIFERLRQNNRHRDAIRWLKHIFDPTDDCKDESPPARYWKYLPFKRSPRENIQNLLTLMESGDEKHSQLIADWARNPFQPYVIARHRPEAFKKNIFRKYVQTCIDYADSLFLTDSKEAIAEAQEYYVMAAHLLGPRPENIESRVKPKPECYATLRGKLDAMSDMLVLLENEFPFSGQVTHHPQSDSGGMQGLSRTLYFCAPQNKKLLELWDIVDDRLYKIRNCLNFAGVYRQLALFDPPIDPGLLVRAAALGMDLGSVMGDIQAPLPAYRFSYMLQKALEMCNECRAFGSALLSALEKNDAEALAVMRSQHEVGILDLMHRVKIRQLDEANAQIDALNASRNTTAQRYMYYQGLLGNSGATVPDPGANIPLAPVPNQPTADLFGIQLIPMETLELSLSAAAATIQSVAIGAKGLAAVAHIIPQLFIHAQPLGAGASASDGGQQAGPAADSGSDVIRTTSDVLSMDASLSGKMGSYFRRQADWTLQNNLAACELMQMDKQIAAANIRVEIAQGELASHEQQMENAKTILDYMTNQKFTNKDLYGWMVSETASSYSACYQMAFASAKKAERTFRYERGLTDSNFIQFGYWDSLRKGLLAGDSLHLALLQMEQAYTDQNTRDYEISRDISLLLNAPLALIALKETGACELSIPESFFDADYPGHYMRRIKSVSLTVPCVVGPYTSLNCTLTLLSNKTRISSASGDQYAEDVENGDDRFVNNFAAVQSVATSHGLNDGGLFEVNFRDERYLPFEGAGVVSRWRLEMPHDNNAFDFDTLSDVVLHMKYTARDGGVPLKKVARQALSVDPQDDLLRLFSLRHEYPGEWHRFLSPATLSDSGMSLAFDLTMSRLPYQWRGKSLAINTVELFLKFKDIRDSVIFTQNGTPLGDYASAKPLKISLTPPGGTAVVGQLKSSHEMLAGVPHASIDVSDQTAGYGVWSIDVAGSDVAALPSSLLRDGAAGKVRRLKPDVIADIVLICHYAVS